MGALGEAGQARRFWARCVQSFNNGGAGRRAGWAISSAHGSNEARSAAGLAVQLDAIAARLSGVYIECADALDLIRRHAGPDALVYADPPYLEETRTGRQRSRRGEVEGLKVSLAGTEDKLAQIETALRRQGQAVQLGIPAFPDIAGRAVTGPPTPEGTPGDAAVTGHPALKMARTACRDAGASPHGPVRGRGCLAA